MYKCKEAYTDDYMPFYELSKLLKPDNKCNHFSQSFNIENVSNIYDPNIVFGIKNDPNINDRTKEKLYYIINKSEEILLEEGLNNIDINYGIVEYHCYNTGIHMPFGIHQDDYGAINYKVNTVIYYLQKDIEGGILKYFQINMAKY